MKKALIAMSMVLAFAGVSFAADAAAPVEKAEVAAPAKKEKKAAKKAPKKAVKKEAAAEKKAE